MSRTRLLAAHLFIVGVIGGSFYDIARRAEHWPFSNYPMFSEIHRSRMLRWPRLYGVTADGREVPVVSYRQLWPLDQSRLPIGLRAIASEPGSASRLADALRDVLHRYEARRSSGEHSGPHLVRLRLYVVSWRVQPFAPNLEEPDERQLLAEAALDRPVAE